MIRVRGTVYYEGGREEVFEVGTAIFVAWEAYARSHKLDAYDRSNANTMNHVVAHRALRIEEGFDVWLASVFGVEFDAELESATVPPTPPAPSREHFSSSL